MRVVFPVDLAVGFVENSLELTEDIGASFDSIILCILGNIDEILSFQINVRGGSAEGNIGLSFQTHLCIKCSFQMALITWRYQWS